jgi:hypothetical protein
MTPKESLGKEDFKKTSIILPKDILSEGGGGSGKGRNM